MDWVGNPATVIPSLILIDAWCWTPFMLMVLSAGLLSLPQDPFEAAEIDGASSYKKLIYITIPLLRPLIFVALLFRIIDAFRTFDIIYVITGGGPGHYSETLNIHTYLQGFNFMRISSASTLAIVMLLILIFICTIIVKFYKSLEL
ncbi:MAG: sugar ABC transporter permease [Candidatus Atribacteria bacterium]|nr:sugar ABC transporter permease [Candidatus Atribacteria bacterium]